MMTLDEASLIGTVLRPRCPRCVSSEVVAHGSDGAIVDALIHRAFAFFGTGSGKKFEAFACKACGAVWVSNGPLVPIQSALCAARVRLMDGEACDRWIADGKRLRAEHEANLPRPAGELGQQRRHTERRRTPAVRLAAGNAENEHGNREEHEGDEIHGE